MTVDEQIAAHTARSVAAVLDVVAGRPVTDRKTGYMEFVTAKALPDGWVQITYFPRPGSDECDFYAGPVLRETEKQITIEVFDDPCTFWKADCIIDRKTVAGA